MGYDIYASGDWTIPSERVADAMRAILEAKAEELEHESVDEWLKDSKLPDPRGLTLEDFSKWADKHGLTENVIIATHEGSDLLCLHFPDDNFRRYDEDDWLFRAVASFAHPDSIIYFSGEDACKWRYVIANGKLSEESGDTVYGTDANAPAVLNNLINLLYEDGKPVSTKKLKKSDLVDLLSRMEDVVREAGFGPQAGKDELQRLAEV